MKTERDWLGWFYVLFAIVGCLFLAVVINCSNRHTLSTTQPVMPTFAEAREAVPNPPKKTSQSDDMSEYVLIDLYIIGPSTVLEDTINQYYVIALYRGAGLVFAQDITDPTNTRSHTLWMGDANMDGKVDIVDLGMLSGNYGKLIDLSDPNSHPWRDGDFNLDGVVDIKDLGILAGNYGKGGQ